MKKRIILLASAFVLMLGTFSTVAFAEETKETKSAEVYVTIADGAGQLALTQEKITVKDNNKDDILTIDEALYAAHEAKYEGGAAAGYASSASEYGISLDKLWGAENGGSYGYCVNNESAMSLGDEVKEGDYINVYAYTDLTTWSDTYSYFDVNVKAIKAGEKAEFTLLANGYDAGWNPLVIPVENAIITINGEKTDYRTDKNGKVAIVLDKEGTYVLSAVSGTDTQILVPAVCELTVAKAENPTESPEPSENTASTNKDENSPQTGDNSQAYLYLAMATAVMAGVVIFQNKRKNDYEK